MDGLKRESHDYRPSLQVFPDLSVDRIAKDLDLVRRGGDRGAKGEPAPESAGLDEVELRVVERIESEKRAAHATLVDEMGVYAQRLSNLDFEGRFSAVSQAAPEAVGEFRTEAAQGRNELHSLRRDMLAAEENLATFKRRHNIERLPRRTSGGVFMLKVGLIMALFLVEIVLNGAFLMKGNELGLTGGISEAAAFAGLNIGGALLAGIFGVRWLCHRNPALKAVGLLALAAYIGLTLAINLGLAHYREVSGSLLAEGGNVVMERIASAPFALADLKSWLFFGVGVLFSLVAFIDALYINDPYPGYGEADKRVRTAHDTYIETLNALTDRLREVRDGATQAMEDASRDLSSRRVEHDTILEARARLARLFDAHQDHLERTGQALLAIYREANAAHRKLPRPATWAQPWRMERIDARVELPVEDPGAREALRLQVERAQATLAEQSQAIHAEFLKAAESYREIDNLFPEQNPHGATVSQAA